ncbi:SMP-30/gluconolactonase/LRE family protein [Ramlibacter tataouinensis]|nr:SMP-30/gluconolactonase/LRE family protein [Ramlibacter tataouinensis]
MQAADWDNFTAQADELGESPFWHPDEQRLYWVDVPGRQLRRAGAEGGDAEGWAMPSEPGCIAPARGGGLVVALRDGIYRARHWGGALQPLARFAHDPATTRFNDGKADPRGRLWAGTIYEPRDARRAELYSIDCRPDNGQGGRPLIQTQAGNAITANGLAFSPDARTVYWADTPHHVIHAWDWDAESNAMRGHRVFRQFEPKPPGWQPGQPGYGGRPDGAAVDREGNYWCAMFEGARLLQISPAGEILRELPVPVRCPTMPCFGGPDLRTLYLTSARRGRPGQELAAMPQSGRVLRLRVDVPGLPVNFFID